ncbi:MAG: hypothetical protein V3V12_00675 [Gammaproteobacteria bacterium]
MQVITRHFRRCFRSCARLRGLANYCLVSLLFGPTAWADDWSLRLSSVDDLLLSDHISWSDQLWTIDNVDQFKLFISDTTVTDGLFLMSPFGDEGPVVRISLSMPSETARCMRRAGAGSIGAIGDDFQEAYLIVRKRW